MPIRGSCRVHRPRFISFLDYFNIKIGQSLANRFGRVTPSDPGSRHVATGHWAYFFLLTKRKHGSSLISLICSKTRVFFFSLAISRATARTELFYCKSTTIVSSTTQMDPAAERRDAKRAKEYFDMLGYVGDAEYGIPKRCACGGEIIDEVHGKEDYDTLPGKRFFTCKNYEGDGFHYRQPWVIGVQEEMERLTRRLEKAEKVINGVPMLNSLIDSLEGQVKVLTMQVDNLHVQVGDMEKLECLWKRLEEAEKVIKGVPDLNQKIETLEEQVEFLTGEVDKLSCHVQTLEKLCFD